MNFEHPEQKALKDAGWEILQDQKSFHIPKNEIIKGKVIGLLKLNDEIVNSLNF